MPLWLRHYFTMLYLRSHLIPDRSYYRPLLLWGFRVVCIGCSSQDYRVSLSVIAKLQYLKPLEQQRYLKLFRHANASSKVYCKTFFFHLI